MNDDTSVLKKALEDATRGLFFPSESDFPIEPITLGEGPQTPETITNTLGFEANRQVEESSLDALFEGLIEAPEGASERDVASAAQFLALKTLLADSLTELRVLRLGAVDIDVVVVGRDASGAWLGIKTHVVET